MSEKSGPDLVTAIVAVFVGGIGVGIVTTFTTPILVSRGDDNMTTYIGVHLALAAAGSLLGAAFVCAVFGFDGQPTYLRALAALLVGEVANAVILVSIATTSNPNAMLGISPFGWLGFILSVYILMSAPSPKHQGMPELEYKLPPGAVWASHLGKASQLGDQERHRRGP